MKPIAIYIHIPFCQRKCHYCDFISYSGKEELIKEYILALKTEIMLYKKEMSDYKINTIFIGGGTPSILEGPQLEEIINCLYKHYHVEDKIEVSIEANPGLLNRKKLVSYYSNGINRLSIGLQACQNDLLHNLGRVHKYEDFIVNLEDARKVGFNNINVDLMFGLPKQSLDDWNASLRTLVQLEIPHISAYSLIIEEGTLFKRWVDDGTIEIADEEIELAMFHDAIDYLKSEGYIHYEISNFAKPNHQCRHNIIYWKNKEYLGFGVAAHSSLNKTRFNNQEKIESYCSILKKGEKPIEAMIPLTVNDEISETMFLGLRMMEGVSIEDFKKRFKMDPYKIYKEKLKDLKRKKLIIYNDSFIKLTAKGIDLANQVFQEMLLD